MRKSASAGMRRILQDAFQAARDTRVAWARGRADPTGEVAGVPEVTPEESGQVGARGVRARGARCGDSARGFGRGRCVDGRHAGRCWVCWRKRAGCSGTCGRGPAGRRRLRGWGRRCRRCARRCARGFCIGGSAPPGRDGVWRRLRVDRGGARNPCRYGIWSAAHVYQIRTCLSRRFPSWLSGVLQDMPS